MPLYVKRSTCPVHHASVAAAVLVCVCVRLIQSAPWYLHRWTECCRAGKDTEILHQLSLSQKQAEPTFPLRLCVSDTSLSRSLSRAPARNQAEPTTDVCVPVAAEKRATNSTSVSKSTAVDNEARITAESRLTRV